jgi:hypothetical protein
VAGWCLNGRDCSVRLGRPHLVIHPQAHRWGDKGEFHRPAFFAGGSALIDGRLLNQQETRLGEPRFAPVKPSGWQAGWLPEMA